MAMWFLVPNLLLPLCPLDLMDYISGEVVYGMDLVRELDALGTEVGMPKARVAIEESGVVPSQL